MVLVTSVTFNVELCSGTVNIEYTKEWCNCKSYFTGNQSLYLDTIMQLGWGEARFFSGAARPSQAFCQALGGRVWKASCWGLPFRCPHNGLQVLINTPAKSCQHTCQRLVIISSWNDSGSWENAALATSGRNLKFNTRSKGLTTRKLPGTQCTFLGGSGLLCQILMLIPQTLVFKIQA